MKGDTSRNRTTNINVFDKENQQNKAYSKAKKSNSTIKKSPLRYVRTLILKWLTYFAEHPPQ